MRILLIIPDLRGGGAQKVVLTLAKALRLRAHEVYVLLMDHVAEYEIPKDIFLHSLIRPDAHTSSGWVGKRILAWMLRKWFMKNSSQRPFDLTIVSLPFASEVAFLAGIGPIWHHIHNSLGEEIDKLSQTAASKAARRLRRYKKIFEGQNLIAVSEGVANDLRRRIGLQHARTVLIYNAFDLDEIRLLAARPDPDLPERPYIVHASRFVPQKRHDLLLDAYASSGIQHDLVLLTNSDPKLVQLIAARGLGSRVVIAGFRTNPYPWYANAAALVLASDFEGFGNVLIEALACGVPVVSTDCPSGPKEILVGELQRYLSPRGDIESLANNLRNVVAFPPKIDADIVERFSIKYAIDRIEALPADEAPV